MRRRRDWSFADWNSIVEGRLEERYGKSKALFDTCKDLTFRIMGRNDSSSENDFITCIRRSYLNDSRQVKRGDSRRRDTRSFFENEKRNRRQ